MVNLASLLTGPQQQLLQIKHDQQYWSAPRSNGRAIRHSLFVCAKKEQEYINKNIKPMLYSWKNES